MVSSSSACFRASRRDSPAMRAGRAAFSRAVNSGSSSWNWKTKPRCLLRKSACCRAERVCGFTPRMQTCPEVGVSRAPIICRRVVLPAPLAPTIAMTSPCATEKETPRNTSSEPKLLWSCSMVMNGVCISLLLVGMG